MLSTRRVFLRIAVPPWSTEAIRSRRFFSERSGELPDNATPNRRQSQHRSSQRSTGNTPSRQTPATRENAPAKTDPGKPSLIAQLFPEETKQYEAQQRQATREVPRLPLVQNISPGRSERILRPAESQASQMTHKEHRTERWLRARVAAEPAGTAVLVLRNASKNLTEEDFRRLIPQGRHIEGWTLQEGDILKVVPARNLDTLEQQNVYYILFTSQLSAHTYQWHVSRIHRLAALHTPTSNTSPIPPPPGYMIEGLDAHAAIQAYALVPPSQKLDLRLLNRPFTPLMQSIVRFQGYKSVVQRQSKLPFEVRLTMYGPQLYENTVRQIMLETGWRRHLSWSGGDKFTMQISQWEPVVSPSARDTSDFAAKNAPGLREGRASGPSGRQLSEDKAAAGGEPGAKLRRMPQHVFILGFHTESAALSFITHWHKRPLELPNADPSEAEEDLPPIAHVEMLW